MAEHTDDLIRLRAYELWQQDGQPEGHAWDHWFRARQELSAGPSDLERDPGIGTTAGSWDSDPADIAGTSTFEGDVLNDTTPQGGVDPDQRGRTNR